MNEQQVEDHFVETTKMVSIGSGFQHKLDDIHLSCYTCIRQKGSISA